MYDNFTHHDRFDRLVPEGLIDAELSQMVAVVGVLLGGAGSW
ncbi:hypothetical protein OHB44_20415 [Micromonospora sp. NBC_00821]|nr:hypothetical protein OHB44_20415 [Micromonospora sp. NBC_00821]